MLKPLLFLSLLCALIACVAPREITQTPTFTERNTVFCIIEIPAGTNKKIEFDKVSKTFQIDKRNEQERVIEYLPYPANYGFINSTFSVLEGGGDGDPLDMLVLCEALPTGTIIETFPIAILKLLDKGEQDYKVICIPVDKKLQTMSANTLDEFNSKYPDALLIIEKWFSYYDPIDPVIIEGWGDEKDAYAEIKRLSVPITGSD